MKTTRKISNAWHHLKAKSFLRKTKKRNTSRNNQILATMNNEESEFLFV
ncbi:hypothetical protein [Flavobacterium branchiophilum]|uniref:Uncharacterized protein n=1 Tax=Flavobacterium branchiophilum TaxID=55197 RepID=A0A543G0L7_9FLAO|nr:hypothetical protein [Flavobacterium branchiophilum]TQM39617.1 hypothetical protein BC670_0432 [Flavobacterium branchiophilum]